MLGRIPKKADKPDRPKGDGIGFMRYEISNYTWIEYI